MQLLWVGAGAAAAGAAYVIYRQIRCDKNQLELDTDPAPLQDLELCPPLVQGGGDSHFIGVVKSAADGCEAEMQLCLRVKKCENQLEGFDLSEIRCETEVEVQVRFDTVDLTAHQGLMELPVALRGWVTCVRELRVASRQLMTLPVWLGEPVKLEVLCVGGGVDEGGRSCTCPLKALPVGLGNLTALRTLELRDCPGLKALPVELENLTGLEDLDLMGCTGLEEVPAWVMDLPSLRVPFEDWRVRVVDEMNGYKEVVVRVRPDRVDLTAHFGLLELPAALRGCVARVLELRMKSGTLTVLPVWLDELASLEVLNLAWCKGLTALLAELGTLTALQELDQSGCTGLTVLPAELGALTAQKMLILSFCEGLTALPAELGAFTGLETLILSGCEGLTVLPAELGALTVLTKLNLTWCAGLTALPTELGALTALKRLNLSVCEELTGLLAEVGVLTALKTLNLSGCPGLTALLVELGTLTALKRLNVSLCKGLIVLPCGGLMVLPAELGAFTALETLNLSWCEGLTVLPAELRALTALETLSLSACEWLTALRAELGALMALKDLNLSGCRELTALLLLGCRGLTALPAELGVLTALMTLELRGCFAPHTPPPAVMRAGTVAVLQYLCDLAKGSAPCHLAKVVLLGDQCAGKSSLANSLVLGHPATRIAEDRTVGIDMRPWWLSISKGFSKDEELVVNIYDNAGQRVYRTSHPLFMTDDALFLHVVKSDASEEGAVAAVLEWVEAVQQVAPCAVMGIVWTRLDLVTDIVTCCSQIHQAVRSRVATEIDGHVQAVDEVMQEAENVFQIHAGWREQTKLRDTALKLLDQNLLVERQEELEEEEAEEEEEEWTTTDDKDDNEEVMEDKGQRSIVDDKGIQATVDARKRLDTKSHHKMQVLEARRTKCNNERPSYDDSKLKLQRLRLQRVRRPRILFSYAVSSHTGHGLAVFRKALLFFLKDQRLFPQVGGIVPLSYTMLDRLAHEGRALGIHHIQGAVEFMYSSFGMRVMATHLDSEVISGSSST